MTAPEPRATLRDPQLDQAPLAPDLAAAIRLELEGDEKIVWAGRPRAWRLAWPGPKQVAEDLVRLALLLAFLGWLGSGMGSHERRLGIIYVPALLASVLPQLSAPFREWLRARRTWYILTDRRAIAWESDAWHGLSGLRIRSDWARDVGAVYRTERSDGSGDLIFREDATGSGSGDLIFHNHAATPELPASGPAEKRRGFLAVDDARSLDFQLWSSFQDDARSREPGTFQAAMPALQDPEFGPVPPPAGLEREIFAELDGSEKLIWVGRPRPWRPVESELFGLVLGLTFLGGSICLVVAGFLTPASQPSQTSISGLMLIALGLGFLMRPIAAWNRGVKTCYALTDRRAIVREPRSRLDGGGFLVQGYPGEALRSIYRSEQPDGSGDLVFAESIKRGKRSRLGFLGVEDVRGIERLVRSTLKGL